MRESHLGDKAVPVIGFGTWRMGNSIATHAKGIKAIRAGVDADATVADTAEMYGNGRSESLVGEAIANIDWEKLFLIDRVLPSNALADRMSHSLDTSLKLLGTDYVGSYLYHWRGTAPLSETVGTLQSSQQQGKIRHWGAPNLDLPDMKGLLAPPGGDQVVVNEDLYNLGSRGIEYSLLSWQRKQGILLIAYTPVAAGDERGQLINNPAAKEAVEAHQVTSWQILSAWAIRDGSTLAIPQSGDPKHAVDNVKAVSLTLNEDDLVKTDKALPKPTSK